MKRSVLILNLAFIALVAVLLTPLVGVATVPIFGVLVLGGIAKHILNKKYGTALFIGLAPEVWIPLVKEQFYPDNSFLSAAMDMSAMVDNDKINFAEAGFKLDVVGTSRHNGFSSFVGGINLNYSSNAIPLQVLTKLPAFQIVGGSNENTPATIGLIQTNLATIGNQLSGTTGIDLVGTRSNITSFSTRVAVANGDIVGAIKFIGDDGTNLSAIGAFILSTVNTSLQSISTGVVPMELQITTMQQAPIIFKTNNSERLRVSASGNLLINSTTDINSLYKLQVTGTSYFSSKLLIGTTTDAGNGILQVTGNLALNTAGSKILVATGSNASVGTATLVSGTVSISTTAVTANSLIFVEYTGTLATTSSVLNVSSRVAGTSFTVTAFNAGTVTTNTTDANSIKYWIIN